MECTNKVTRGIWAAMSVALTLAATTAYAGTGHVKKHRSVAHKTTRHSKMQTARDPFRLPTEYWIKTRRIRIASRPSTLHLPPLVIADPLPDPKNIIHDPIAGPAPSFDRPVLAPRRMAGVVFANNGVYAVLDTGGNVQMVQPGDRVNGGKVISIESDGLTIRTDSQRVIRVPLASSNQVEQTYSDPAGSGQNSDGDRGPSPEVNTQSSARALRPDYMFE